MSEDKAALKKLIRSLEGTLCGNAKAQDRVKAVNTLLNGGHNLKLLDATELESLWESVFYALWFAEMGRGCEEIIASVERACQHNHRLTRIGFRTIAKKWYGLDHYRIDKVSHLARHLLPCLIEQQITLWFKNYRKNRELGTRDVVCPKLLNRTFKEVTNSYGLCYFLLEILAEEISKTLIRVYERMHITHGKYELKANLIIFLYQQVIHLATDIKLDARLLRTFDQYVIKKFVEEILPNESQLTQILMSLRLYQTLDYFTTKSISGKCRALLKRWSTIIKDIHENCINGEYFPLSVEPKPGTIRLSPRY